MANTWVILVVLGLVAVVVLLLVCSCLLAIFRPRAAWYLQVGWKFKGAEPSGLYLALTRIGGFFGLLVLGAVFTFLVMISRATPQPPGPPVVSSPAPGDPTPR